MRHEYLDTLFKIREMEEKIKANVRKIPDANIRIHRMLIEEDADFDLSPSYISKVRGTIRKTRMSKKDDMTVLEYLEKNRQNLTGTQERDVENLINKERIERELKNKLEREISTIRDCKYCINGPTDINCYMMKFPDEPIYCTDVNVRGFVLDRSKLNNHPKIKKLVDIIRQNNPDFTLE